MGLGNGIVFVGSRKLVPKVYSLFGEKNQRTTLGICCENDLGLSIPKLFLKGHWEIIDF